MNFSEQQPGVVLRKLRHGKETIPYAYAFPRETAHLVFGSGKRTVEQSLRLLEDHGRLLRHPSDTTHHFTKRTTLPDGTQARLIVVRDAGDRLRVERIVRGLWFDARPPRAGT